MIIFVFVLFLLHLQLNRWHRDDWIIHKKKFHNDMPTKNVYRIFLSYKLKFSTYYVQKEMNTQIDKQFVFIKKLSKLDFFFLYNIKI
jgi:hypothetical protein